MSYYLIVPAVLVVIGLIVYVMHSAADDMKKGDY